MSGDNTVALGFRAHSGWAVVVAVAGFPDSLAVVERRRIETVPPSIGAARQPYHAAAAMDIEAAAAWIRQCREASGSLAAQAVRVLVAHLKERGHAVAGAGILFASGRPLPDLSATLRSHAMIHTAEGEFFREALVHASEQSGLPVIRVKEREVWDRASLLFRQPASDLRRRIDELGRSLGPPWRQDEKLASLAAWISGSESAKHTV